MNERIKELYTEAGVIGKNFNPFAYEQWYLDALEKFAELIVRECANVAAEHDALDIYEEIREHFGVEE